MRLLRLRDVEVNRGDRVYAASRLHALVLFGVVLAAVAWIVFHSYRENWKPGYFIAAVVLLVLDFIRRFVTARFRPSNWQARMNDSGVYIQFRSYLNYHLPADDLTVVFLSFGEIRSARLVKERVETPDPMHGPNASTTQFLRYIELEVAGDLTALIKAVNDEISENAPEEKSWYGRSSTLYQDHPVRISSPPFLRIRWTATPGTHNFLRALRPYTTIADTVSLKQDFTHLQSLSREEQEKQLRELAARGETVTAIYTARKLYGCGLAEAKETVEKLQANSSSAGGLR